MINNNTVLTELNGSIATIWLNRPHKHNSLNIEMISGLLLSLQYFNKSDNTRIIVIRGKGKSFCAGADLNWMQQSSLLSPEENFSECESLARLYYELYHCQKITLCLVHGSSIGGANGIISASDISIAEETTVFALSEVRVGLFPATIAPYVISKTGRSKAIDLMLTGRKFTAAEASQWGLVNQVFPAGKSEESLNNIISHILKGAPIVQNQIKEQLYEYSKLSTDQSVINKTASLLAQTRISNEAKEGINAFLQKRKPTWDQELT